MNRCLQLLKQWSVHIKESRKYNFLEINPCSRFSFFQSCLEVFCNKVSEEMRRLDAEDAQINDLKYLKQFSKDI